LSETLRQNLFLQIPQEITCHFSPQKPAPKNNNNPKLLRKKISIQLLVFFIDSGFLTKYMLAQNGIPMRDRVTTIA